MPITRLGHVGIHVHDLARSTAFYREVLGLHITDEMPGFGTFLSSQDRVVEHHELLLLRGRTDGQVIQQISFRCDSLQDIRNFHRVIVARSIPINMIVSHGNAIGLYFQDPDGNQVEVYYPTGIDWPQPCGVPVDLSASDEEILSAHLSAASNA